MYDNDRDKENDKGAEMKIATETTINVEKWDEQTGLWFVLTECANVEDGREYVLMCMKADRAVGRSGRYQIVKEVAEVYSNLEDAIWGESQNA